VSNILRMPAALKEIGDTIGFADDFEWYVTAHRWTSLAADAGASVAVAAGAAGGILALTTGGTDNNEALAYSASVFKPAANRPLYCEALLQWTEANTDDANVAFGLASSPGADLLIDNGAGMRATGTIIAIYKVDGETTWRFVTRNGTSVTVSVSQEDAGGSAYQKLGIEVLDVMGSVATVVPTIDGRLMIDATSGQPIRHTLLLTSIAAAGVFAGNKAGGANSEVLSVDYIAAYQAR
jgi:hypothetical protein